MLHIAICDDKQNQLDMLRNSVLKYFSEHSDFAADIVEFINPSRFLEALEKSGGFDIALLDICMPGVSGIEIGKTIRERHDNTEIIFLTTSDEFAVEAFALKAAHYCLKPYTQEQFDSAMERAMERFIGKEPKKLILKSANGSVHSINAESVLYIESLLKNLQIHTSETVLCENRHSLSSLQNELERLFPGQFISPYRGYVVNMSMIKTITTEEIVLHNGEKIPIKLGAFRKIRDSFFDWSFRKKGV